MAYYPDERYYPGWYDARYPLRYRYTLPEKNERANQYNLSSTRYPVYPLFRDVENRLPNMSGQQIRNLYRNCKELNKRLCTRIARENVYNEYIKELGRKNYYKMMRAARLYASTERICRTIEARWRGYYEGNRERVFRGPGMSYQVLRRGGGGPVRNRGLTLPWYGHPGVSNRQQSNPQWVDDDINQNNPRFNPPRNSWAGIHGYAIDSMVDTVTDMVRPLAGWAAEGLVDDGLAMIEDNVAQRMPAIRPIVRELRRSGRLAELAGRTVQDYIDGYNQRHRPQ